MDGTLPERLSTFLRIELGEDMKDDELGQILDVINRLGVTDGTLESILFYPSPNHLLGAVQAWEARRKLGRQYKPAALLDWIADLTLQMLFIHWLEAPDIRYNIAQELSRRGAGLRKTTFLYYSLATKAAYEVARRLADFDRARSNRYLRKTLLLADRAINLALPYELETQERYLRGYIGVSNLFLGFATTGDERHTHLLKAVTNLRRSATLGDNSIANKRYFAEALSELVDFDRDRAIELLEEAISALRLAISQGQEQLDMVILLGRILIQYNSATRDKLDKSEVSLIRESIDCYNRGLSEENSFRSINIQGRRGQARLFLYWETGDQEDLNHSIEDLRTAYQRGELQWTPHLIDALITRQAVQPAESAEDALEAWTIARNEDGRVSQTGAPIDLRHRRLKAAYIRGCAAGDSVALEEVISLAGESDKEIWAKATGILGLHRQDGAMIEEALTVLSDLPPGTNSGGPGLLPKLADTLARMIADDDPDRALELLEIATRSLMHSQHSNDPLRTWLAAKQRFQAWRIGGLPEDLENALVLSQQARHLSPPSPENLVLAANIELQIAKTRQLTEERREFLEAAAEDLVKGLPGAVGLNEMVSDSKLGEVLLRLGAITGYRRQLEQACDLLASSYTKGNHSAELCGLLGDAFYHLAKNSAIGQRSEILKNALKWKSCARNIVGQEAFRDLRREHFSLCARIHLSLHEIGDTTEDHLALIMENLNESRRIDPAWPWPVCQMAEIAELIPPTLLLEYGPFIINGVPANSEEALWYRAAEMTLTSPEFGHQTLGGKSAVWYAEDNLGLVSSTFVFKPAPERVLRERDGLVRAKRGLEEEMKRVTDLGTLLCAEGLSISTPRMIGLLETSDGRPVLAMRRLAGKTLAQALIQNREDSLKHLRVAVSALAAYQARTPFSTHTYEQDNQRERLFKVIRRTQKHISAEEQRLLENLLPVLTKLPLVAKRDAHPGNWFVTTRDELVVLDVEYPTCKLFIEELCQLAEDVPVFSWDEDGIRERLDLLQEYRQSYEHYSGKPDRVDDTTAWKAYLAFSSLLGLFGLSLSEARLSRTSITPVERGNWEIRRKHYSQLTQNALSHLATLR